MHLGTSPSAKGLKNTYLGRSCQGTVSPALHTATKLAELLEEQITAEARSWVTWTTGVLAETCAFTPTQQTRTATL